MQHVSICLFKMVPCVCEYPGDARTVIGSHSEWSLNSIKLTCCSWRQGEVSLTAGCLFTQCKIPCFCSLMHYLLQLFSFAFPSQVSCFICSRFWYGAAVTGSTHVICKPKLYHKAKRKTLVAANLWFHSCHLSISNTAFPHPSNCTGMILREPWHPCRAEAKISHC